MKPHLKAFLLCLFSLLLAQTNFAQTVVKSISASLYLLNNNGSTTLADGTVAQYSDLFDTAVDWQDAKKLNNINENFGLMRDGISLAIERRPFIISNDTLFFRLTNTTSRKYRVIIIADSMPGVAAAWKDNYSGTTIPIGLGDTSSIDIDIMTTNPASADPNRFKMVFSMSDGGPLPVRFASVHAYEVNDDNIDIEWSVSDESNIDHYEVERSADGNNFTKEAMIVAIGNNNSFIQYHYNTIKASLSNNYYRIKAIDKNANLVYSKIVSIKSGKVNEYITLNTDIGRHGMIGLDMKEQEPGVYHIRLMTSYGAILTAKSFQHQKESSSETITVTKNLAKGIYMLEIIKPNGDRQCFKMIN